MSQIATYSFLPWLRQGLANRIQQSEGDTSVKLRPSIQIDLKIRGEAAGGILEESITKDISLYGPGDIVGIDKKAIIKNEPHNWITNFESNYMPYVDFYDEDFAWRYTPAAPDLAKHRLRPWIALIVLKEDEFKDGKNIQGRPLPFIEVNDPDTVLPPENELWAWAHVHANRGITPSGNDRINSTNSTHIITQLNSLLNQNPDLAQCRVLCPRKLDPQTAYYAFLIPSFEAGRLAGLGLELDANPYASFPAWGQPYPSGSKAEPMNFPVYHRWYFRTGELGDFEYLVRLLEPKPVDERVGRRPIDVQQPGSNLPGITDPDLGGVLKLGGALRIPFDTMSEEDKQEFLKYENWDQPYPHGFQEKLSAFLNLPDDYSVDPAADANSNSGLGSEVENDPDPLIAPPIYGQWHAMVKRLLKERDGSNAPHNQNWVHELNLDPRHRTTAGFGTKIVQENQETYMDAAWEQVGDVIAANRRIRLGLLGREASRFWYTRTLTPMLTLQAERAMQFTAPMQKRVMSGQVTAHYAVQKSVVPRALVSAPLRRTLRPRGKLVRKLLPFEGNVQPGTLITRVNAGEVTAAPPKHMPEALPKPEDAAPAITPTGIRGLILRLLSKPSWLKWLFLVIAVVLIVLLFLFTFGTTLTSVLGAAAAIFLALGIILLVGERETEAAEILKEENQTPEAVDALPKSPNFRIVLQGDTFKPKRGGKDSEEAVRFKTGLRDAFSLIQAAKTVSVVEPRQTLDLAAFNQAVVTQINPEVTIPRMVYAGIRIPARIRAEIGETFTEAMAYPEFDIPMYKPLTDLSAEMFLPNIQFISENSISLLETNQPFIEAYMVGLNHEFARELLWREYPTDQRGSYFRQFWDVSSYLDRSNSDDEALREKLRDIPPLHRWPRASVLGDHDHREQGGDKENEVVLVIRGELLKKYPTAVIYAHKAKWAMTNGNFDPKKERELVDLTAAEQDNPPESKVLTPIYEAKVDPDIYFFGFDITIPDALGDDENPTADNAGWFFIIKERPGEPRFGLDIEGGSINPASLQVWNDLAWDHVSAEGAQVQFLRTNHNFAITGTAPSGVDIEKAPQWEDDRHVGWTPNTNAADLAYILYQVPVMVAVHASEMLPKN